MGGYYVKGICCGEGDMTDKEFESLQDELPFLNWRLEVLQRRFIKETGKRWVPNEFYNGDRNQD